MGTLKIGGIAFGIIFLIAIIYSVISVALDDDSQPQEKFDFEIEQERIVKLVQDYQGKDHTGETLVDALSIMISIAYPDESILDNPSTNVGWYAFEDYAKGDGIFQVGFEFETYREKAEYIWYVDTNNNNKISAGNQGAKSILNVVNSFN